MLATSDEVKRVNEVAEGKTRVELAEVKPSVIRRGGKCFGIVACDVPPRRSIRPAQPAESATPKAERRTLNPSLKLRKKTPNASAFTQEASTTQSPP